MDARGAVAGGLAWLTLLAVVAGTGATGPVAGAVTTPDRTVGTGQVDPDTVLLRADVRPDGTAAWQVEYRVLLDDQNTSDAFESVAADVRENPAGFTDRFGDRMRRTARSAENETGREMAIRNVTVETGRQELGQTYGIVRYEFTWRGFAAANDTTIRAGDALAGFFLDAESQLTITWPDGYRRGSVSPPPTETREHGVVWRGQLDFGSEGPRVVASTAAPTTTDGAGGGSSAGDAGGANAGGSAVGGSTLVVAVAVAAVLVIGGIWLLVRRSDLSGADEGTDAGAAGDGDEAGAASGNPPDVGGDDEPPAELLSNEERVLRLLEEHGGRVKQKQVAEELDWTDAKTSQVVKGMREDGRIEGFRLGRENVLSLPDEDGT